MYAPEKLRKLQAMVANIQCRSLCYICKAVRYDKFPMKTLSRPLDQAAYKAPHVRLLDPVGTGTLAREHYCSTSNEPVAEVLSRVGDVPELE